MKIKEIYKDLERVLSEAKRMGVKKVTAFYDIPLENVETVMMALNKADPKKAVITEYCSKACPVCGFRVNGKYCSNCGQAIIH